jgi:hypothetical protein
MTQKFESETVTTLFFVDDDADDGTRTTTGANASTGIGHDKHFNFEIKIAFLILLARGRAFSVPYGQKLLPLVS